MVARRSEIGSGMGIGATKEKKKAEATGASLKSQDSGKAFDA